MKYFLILLTFSVLASCVYRSYYEREITGQWFSQQWLVEGEPTYRNAWMAFEPDSTYRAVFVQNQEQGRYWIDGYKLYTQADGEDLIFVKIESLEDDTMHISMNRGGDREEIVFVRRYD
jgi:hypothetical protein